MRTRFISGCMMLSLLFSAGTASFAFAEGNIQNAAVGSEEQTAEASGQNIAEGSVNNAAGPGQKASEGPGQKASSDSGDRLGDNTLEWDEIDDLVDRYNMTVLKNRNELANDERRSYDASQVSSYLLDQADDFQAMADSASNAMVAAQMQTSADSLRMQAESNVSDFRVITLNYEKIEKQTAAGARKAFLNYYAALYEKDYAVSNIEYLERMYASAENRMKYGMATELEVLNAREAVDSAKAALLQKETDIGTYRTGLLVTCGWKYDSDGIIGPLPEADPSFAASVDYGADLDRGRSNNITLKIDEIRLANAKSGSYTELIVEQNENQLKDDTDAFGIAFKAAYDSLVNSTAAYNNAVSDRNAGAQSLAMSEKQYALGTISAVELESARNNQRSLELSEKKACLNLISAEAVYRDAVNGLV